MSKSKTCCFNPRAHTGRDLPTRWMPSSAECFNPRAHTGRDSAGAPQQPRPGGFNPRAHTGRDITIRRFWTGNDVSIHAPTQGATQVKANCPRNHRCFNPRAHTGRDCISHTNKTAIACFNPRAHTGRDFLYLTRAIGIVGFNPRAHTGRDAPVNLGAWRSEVSIHAPTQGATHRLASWVELLEVSIHAPTQGATWTNTTKPTPVRCFNPRAHTGRDFQSIILLSMVRCFNPRAHTGRDGITTTRSSG